MRVTTAQFYRHSAAAIGELQSRTARTQQQLSSGQRLLSAADDPVADARLREVGRRVAETEQHQRNLDVAVARLSLSEAVLADVGEALQRSRELTLQGNNAALSAADRQSIAGEIRQIHDHLLGLANSQDGAGEYLFAGFSVRTAPFASAPGGGVSYLGDQGRLELQVGSDRRFAAGEPGTAVFQDPAGVDLFAVLDGLASALEQPAAGAAFQQAVSDGLSGLDRGLEQVLAARGRFGAGLNALQAQRQSNDDFLLQGERVRADLNGLDYAEAAARLNAELTALQAAQQSFVRVQNLSLFKFLG